MEITEPLLLAGFAILVGALVGLTGVGGGAVMTPLLIVGFGVNPLVAVATDLVYATVIKIISALIHGRAGNVDWPVLRRLWLGSIPGVAVGIGFVFFLLGEDLTALTFLLAGLLLLSGVSMILGTNLLGKRPIGVLGVSGFGGFIGFSVATTSIGAGALGMAVLRRIFGDAAPSRLVGTDIVHAIPIALLAGGAYWVGGLLDWSLLGLLLLGSIPGVIVGSMLTNRVNTNFLRKILGSVLIVAAAGIVLR